MDLFVLTRSRARDYGFLGDDPPGAWWTRFRHLTQFEYPTLLWEADPTGEWRLFLSAIPSDRRDRTGTRIRYSLVVYGDRSEADALDGLLAAWLDDTESVDNALAKALDARFPEELCDHWLGGRAAEVDAPKSPARRLAEVVGDLPMPAPPEPAGRLRQWYGAWAPSLANPLRAHVQAALGSDERGAAFVLTLCDPTEDVQDLSEWMWDGDRVAVLTPLSDATEPTGLPEPPPEAQPPPKAPARLRTFPLVLLMGLLLLLVVLVLFQMLS